MEDTLRETGLFYYDAVIIVLILVLMEDTLRDLIKGSELGTYKS